MLCEDGQFCCELCEEMESILVNFQIKKNSASGFALEVHL